MHAVPALSVQRETSSDCRNGNSRITECNNTYGNLTVGKLWLVPLYDHCARAEWTHLHVARSRSRFWNDRERSLKNPRSRKAGNGGHVVFVNQSVCIPGEGRRKHNLLEPPKAESAKMRNTSVRLTVSK